MTKPEDRLPTPEELGESRDDPVASHGDHQDRPRDDKEEQD